MGIESVFKEGNELGFRKAREEEVHDALKATDVAKQFKQSKEVNYQLWLGVKVGDQRNQFWYNTKSKKYEIDYANNLIHIPGTYLGPLGQMLEESNGKSRANAEDSLQLLVLHIEENLQKCDEGEVDMNGKSLRFQNKGIYDDFRALKEKIIELTKTPFEIQKFRIKVIDIFQFYREQLRAKYMTQGAQTKI